MADLAVVIPTHGRSLGLIRAIESISNATKLCQYRVELFVICSPETDLGPLHALVRKIESCTSGNLAIRTTCANSNNVNSKRNLGLNLSQSPVTLFIDDDCEVSSADFLDRHILAHSVFSEPIIGGIYSNIPHGYLARVYSANYEHWLALFKNSLRNPPIVGGNLSIKTGQRDPWIRFNEDFSFGGTERELVLRTLQSGQQVRLIPELNIDHHIDLTLLDFFRKAFRQGRGESRLRRLLPSSSAWQELDAASPSKPTFFLEWIFRVIFKFGIQFELGRSDSPIVTRGISAWITLMNESPLISSARVILVRKIISPLRTAGAWLKVYIFWRGFYQLYQAFRGVVRALYWQGLFRIFIFVESNLWRFRVAKIRAVGAISWIGYRILEFYSKFLFPLMVFLGKPYFFLKYQIIKRNQPHKLAQ